MKHITIREQGSVPTERALFEEKGTEGYVFSFVRWSNPVSVQVGNSSN